MDAAAILDRLREVGVTAKPEGDELVLEPGSKVPPDLYGPIRANKPQIMATLLRPRLVAGPPKWHAEAIAREVIEHRIAIFWADVFQEVIAFVVSEELRDQVPAGVVTYTLAEIETLFADGKRHYEPSTLRLTHTAKREANAKIMEVSDKE